MKGDPRREAVPISVVIPTYNRAPLIGRAIESVLSQRLPPLEVIVVDDGSQDDTRREVETFRTRVRYISQENAGAAAARNRGMQSARHKWVAPLDSDDVWFDTHLERMAEVIRSTGGSARFYFADTIAPKEKGGGSWWDLCGFSISADYVLAASAAEWVLKRPQPMMVQSTVFDREAFLSAGGFFEALRIGEDTHLFLKLGLNGSACAVAGYATRMTSDDVPENRLTLTYEADIRRTQMQVLMFEDLVARRQELRGPQRRELQGRLANAHRRLVRQAWVAGQRWAAVRHAAAWARNDPLAWIGGLSDRLGGRRGRR